MLVHSVVWQYLPSATRFVASNPRSPRPARAPRAPRHTARPAHGVLRQQCTGRTAPDAVAGRRRAGACARPPARRMGRVAGLGPHCAGSRRFQRIASISASSSGGRRGAPGGKVLVELRLAGHADDGAAHAPAAVAEGQRQPRRREAGGAPARCTGAPPRSPPDAPSAASSRRRTSPAGPAARRHPGRRCRTCRSARRRPAASRPAATPAGGASPRPGRCRAHGWSTHRGSARWRCEAGAARPGTNSATPYGDSLDRPMWRTLPALTSVAIASSGRWMDETARSLAGSK